MVSTNLLAVSALKAVTYRLASTPTTQLPRYVAQLSASIWMARDILSAPAETLKRAGAGPDPVDLSVVVHRLRTQLSSLLQDRTVEGRWVAVVLTKATIEAGGSEVLAKCNAWVRSLLAILKRPESPSTRAFTVLVLTRIFMLTWDHVSLVREITTPALPTFVATCLSHATNQHCSKAELLNILEAFQLLLPHHPTIFRTNEAVLRSLLLRIISSTDAAGDASYYYCSEHIYAAQRLLPALPFVLPKQAGPEKWEESLQSVVDDANQTCDRVFYPIIEASGKSKKTTDVTIASAEHHKSGLPAWSGLEAGIDRLIGLLKSITAYFDTATQSTVKIRLGTILDLLSRIFSALPPGSDKHGVVKPNPESPKEQRDILLISLPAIHVAAFELLSHIIHRLGPASMPFLSPCYDQCIEVFKAESLDFELRVTVYKVVVQMLEVDGLSMPRDRVAQISPLLQHACRDLLPDQASSNATKKAALLPTTDSHKKKTAGQASETTTTSTTSMHVHTFPQLQKLASALMVTALSTLDATYLPRSVRTQIDRTAVLTQNKDALIASVLNPPPAPSGNALQTSLLPVLARLFPDEAEVEALIRPRMPVIRTGQADANDEEEEEEDLIEDDLTAAKGQGQDEDMQDTTEPSHVEEASTAASALQSTASDQDQAAAFDTFVGSMKNKRPLPAPQAETSGTKRPRNVNVALPVATLVNEQPSTTQFRQASSLSDVDDNSDIELPELTLEQDTDEEED